MEGWDEEGSSDSRILTVPSRKVGRIIGKGGSKIRELQDDSGAKIEVQRDSQGEDTSVEISGPPDAINLASKLINDLINDDSGSRSFGGSSNRFGDSGSSFGSGRNDRNRGFGRGRREEDGGFGRAQQGGRSESSEMQVPSNCVGMIIGKGGSKIRELQDDSGAKIDVQRDSQGEYTTLEISGYPDAINTASKLINDLINDDSRSFGGSSNRFGDSGSSFGGGRNDRNRGFGRGRREEDGGFGRGQQGGRSESTKMQVPSSCVGKIIGKGGSRIRELQDDSGANIKVQRDSDSYGETTIEISGSADTISKAKDLINEVINDSN